MLASAATSLNQFRGGRSCALTEKFDLDDEVERRDREISARVMLAERFKPFLVVQIGQVGSEDHPQHALDMILVFDIPMRRSGISGARFGLPRANTAKERATPCSRRATSSMVTDPKRRVDASRCRQASARKPDESGMSYRGK